MSSTLPIADLKSLQPDHIQQIFYSANVAIFLFDPVNNSILEANPKACSLLGYTRDELLQMQPGDIHPGEVERFNEFATTVQEEGTDWTNTLTCTTKGGQVIYSEISASVIESEGQNLIVAMVQERADADEQAEIEQLHSLNQMQDRFISDVLHELLTPVSSLKFLTYLMSSHTEQLDTYIEIAQREIERMEGTIKDLRRLTQIDQGQVSLQLEHFDLSTLIEEFISDRMRLAEQKNISVICKRSSEDQMVLGDKGLLSQAINTLYTNAVNYTPEGGEIRVTMQRRMLNGNEWVGFNISDTGPGIPLEEQSHLFERFYRGETARKSGVSGTGLGLAIAQEIIEYHEGLIICESSGIAGEGASFQVWLPVIVKIELS